MKSTQEFESTMSEQWISDRLRKIDASGIRKVFDLAATMKNPINLSIGQPHFDTPENVKLALKAAVDAGKNVYSQSQGIKPLLETLNASVQSEYHDPDREVFVTSGTSGGLMLTLMTLVNPGEEVIVFDPYFVMYKHIVTLCGGVVKLIDTYPDFRIDLEKVEAAITPQTKVIICNSPGNPTGAVATAAELKGLAELAARHNVALLSDEIYRAFQYDDEFISPAKWNRETIVIDGFSKSHSMTGLRLGFAHGPRELIQQMIKLQQFTFVCAPQPVQWAGVEAWTTDITDRVADYKRKRDFMVRELSPYFEIHGAQGAFYLFLKAPWGTGSTFVAEAIRNELLIIPGNVFSQRDTHFRISFATEDATLQRGVEVLQRLAKMKPAE